VPERAGNRRGAKTVPEVLHDLEARFGLKRVVFVGDRGAWAPGSSAAGAACCKLLDRTT
jgi:hypothetical protein